MDGYEAIDFVNARDHPLALYVFSKDPAYKAKGMSNLRCTRFFGRYITAHIYDGTDECGGAVFDSTTSGSCLANEVMVQTQGTRLSLHPPPTIVLTNIHFVQSAEGLPFGGIGPSGCTLPHFLDYLLLNPIPILIRPLIQPAHTLANPPSTCLPINDQRSTIQPGTLFSPSLPLTPSTLIKITHTMFSYPMFDTHRIDMLMAGRYPPYSLEKSKMMIKMSMPSLPPRPASFNATASSNGKANGGAQKKRWGKWFLFVLALALSSGGVLMQMKVINGSGLFAVLRGRLIGNGTGR
jgi:hypothetical protein